MSSAMALPAASSRPLEEPCPTGKQLTNQLAAAVRSINWSYAIFWSVSSTHPGVLTWTEGFYNGEIKTWKIANWVELTADQLIMLRNEQLRELYEFLHPGPGECDHRAARPVAALSLDELGDTEWYYLVCMTYAFRPGQGLPGRSFTSNEHVWLWNVHLADSKTFTRKLLAKSANVQTVVCIPLMSGVLELGTTDLVKEDPDLICRVTTSFWELQFPSCTKVPCSSPSDIQAGEAADIDGLEDLDHNAMKTMVTVGQELGDVEIQSSASLQHVTNEIDELSSLWEDLDLQLLEHNSIMEGPIETPVNCTTSFTAWTRRDSDEVAAPRIGGPQKLLKKVVAGGAWENCDRGGSTKSTQESDIRKMVERRRREKLNELFLILKSLIRPPIRKMDRASILEETIAYLKELERRVEELESVSLENTTQPFETRLRGHNSRAKRTRASELSISDDTERKHHWILSKDGTTNVITITVTDKDVLLEVHCQREELLMNRVFDAIKTLHLDVLSVQSSTSDGFMELKIRAQSMISAAIVPRMISEAVRKAIDKKRRDV